ncbi:MAG: AEC family transporter [Bacteriovoracaceae bacterium]|nr:AEC family transporter [Bacteriovoracaceae bacterium]
MSSIFFITFGSMFSAISQIFIVMGIAALLLRKKVISSDQIAGLSQLTVVVLLPALSFTKIVNGFRPDQTAMWWSLPLIGILMVTFGIIVAKVLYGKTTEKGFLLALSAFQNCTFFVLPIGKIIYPNQFDQFALYVFLMALFLNPYLWSVGKVLVTNTSQMKLKQFITPPLIANLLAIFFVFSGLDRFLPQILMGPMELLGSATVPVATFILGATLGSSYLNGLPKLSDCLKMLFTRFAIIPGVMIGLLYYFKMKEVNPLMADFLVIEAAAAPATALVIQTRKYGGHEKAVGSLMFLSYVVCLFMLPLWLALWRIL